MEPTTTEELTLEEFQMLNKLLFKFYNGVKHGTYGTNIMHHAHNIIVIKGVVADFAYPDLPY